MPEPSPSLANPSGGTTLAPSPAAEAIADTTPPQPTRRRRRGLGIGFWVCTAWLVVVALLAAVAPWVPFIEDPEQIDGLALREPPTAQHWFGGDDLGRDIFARVIYGGRVSLFIGVAAIAVGLLIGGTIGLTAGYFRGRYERVSMAAMDVMLAFPALLLAMTLVAFLSDPGTSGGTLRSVTVALSVLAIPGLARITRANTLVYAQREFVLAARTLGAKNRRILVREILPNVVPPMASFALVAIAIVIVAEGALSFLGLSVKAPQPTWGNMINEGRGALEFAPHISLVPAGVMFLTLLSLNYVGDQLRRRFDVKEGAL